MVAKSQNKAKSYHDDFPDRFGEELADDAHIWRVYNKVADADDENRVENWNRGLDNLALFAGLLSAVTSAFLIEARKDLNPDPILQALRSIDARLSHTALHPEHFTAPGAARAVNFLWVASLILSLTAALIALMGKDWIGMYVRMPSCNLRQRADIRTFRRQCTEDWHMSGVIATAPLLLHISIVLFGAGLVIFMSSDALTLGLAAGLSGIVGILYSSVVLSAIFLPTSPFQSPATLALHRLLLSDVDPAELPNAAETKQPAPPLTYWDAIPAAPNPDRIIRSIIWLRAASSDPQVDRVIIAALGDQTTIAPSTTLGCQVAQCLYDEVVTSGLLHPKEAELRVDFRSRLPRSIDWARTDLVLVMRYLILRANAPKLHMTEAEDSQLDALLRDALLDTEMSPEYYIYAVCLAANRGHTIDTPTVVERGQHISVTFKIAVLLMNMFPIPRNAHDATYDALIVMTKCFGWHRGVEKPAFIEFLNGCLDRVPASLVAVALPTQTNLVQQQGRLVELLTELTLRHARHAFSEAIDIMLDLLPPASAGVPVQDLEPSWCLFNLFAPENRSDVSDGIWEVLKRSSQQVKGILVALPFGNPAQSAGGPAMAVHRSVVALILDWLLPHTERLSTLPPSHHQAVVSSLYSLASNLTSENKLRDIMSTIARLGNQLEKVTPIDRDWDLFHSIASTLAARASIQSYFDVAWALSGQFTIIINIFDVPPSDSDHSLYSVLNRLVAYAPEPQKLRFLQLLKKPIEEDTRSGNVEAGPSTPEPPPQGDEPQGTSEATSPEPTASSPTDRPPTVGSGARLPPPVSQYPIELYDVPTIAPDEIQMARTRPISGGFIDIYRATWRGLGVAVKKQRFPFDDEYGIQRCMVFPWAENSTVMRYTAKFPRTDRLQLVLDVARGLAYMHSRDPQILHMSIHPGDILVNSTGRAMIGGFGLSITLPDGDYTARMWWRSYGFDVPQGLPPYQAPEMFESEGEQLCSAAVDIFGWAMTAVEIVSGVRPLGRNHTHIHIVASLLGGTRPLQKDHSENLRSDAAELLGRCWPLLERGWAQSPTERPSMAEVVEELTRIKDERAQAAAPQGSAPAASTPGKQ